jgi:hypothetical protein
MEKETIEPYYQGEAQRLIDAMFDAKVFSEKITRNDMKNFEDLIAYYFQSHVDSARRSWKFVESIKHLK